MFVQNHDSDVFDRVEPLMPLVRLIASTDRPWLSTLDTMREELVEDSLFYRYNAEACADGLEGDEATFSICSLTAGLPELEVDGVARRGIVEV